MGRKNPEFVMHSTIVEHLQARAHPDVVWWHTPNGGRRHIVEAARFKQLGVRRGVSDLVFVHNSRFFALELKANTKPTVEQMQFVADINTAGGHACICDDLDRALKTLKIWDLIRGV